MSEYTMQQIEEKAQHYGEMMIVLESDREYDYHNLTVTTGPTEGEDNLAPLREDEIRIEGLLEDEDGDIEDALVEIPVGRIEHIYTHREV